MNGPYFRNLVRIILGVIFVVVPERATTFAAEPANPPFQFGAGDPRVDPDEFTVTVFADGLFYPVGMTELVDGSILVGTSRPTGGGYFSSTGELLRLVDADRDGVADGPGTPLAVDLPGSMTALARADDLIYATSNLPMGTKISVLRTGTTPASPLTVVGSLDLGYEVPMWHGTYALATTAVKGKPHQHYLFFNVGSVGNDTAGAAVYLSGLVEATLTDASIYRLTVDSSGKIPDFSDLTLIATGLRNAAGLAIHPRTGALYCADNGIDRPDVGIVALSPDELNVITARNLGGQPEDFGFPDAYLDYATGESVGQRGSPPLIAFFPRAGDESEGVSEIAIVPAGFPTGLNNGIVVGFHGQWDEVGLVNEENPLLYVDLATGDYFPLIGNDEPAIGHLDGVLATDDALYIADLTGVSSLIGVEPTGAIYRIAPVALT